MENARLIALMKTKGISKTTLSSLTKIPLSTLNRIIKGETLQVKMPQMQAIATALNTSIYSIFDMPVEIPLAGAIRPEEAGESVTKLLNPDESLMLYWYQNSFQDGRNAIFARAKAEYFKTQTELVNKSYGNTDRTSEVVPYEQLSLEDLNAK